LHVADAGHEGTQRHALMAASQACPVGHRRPVPHDAPAPQGLGMVVPQVTPSGDGALAQVSEHTHAPAVQLCVEVQTVPQAPQLVVSLAVSTHTPLHEVVPEGHRQRPVEHDVPAGQRVPQAPQLFESVAVFTQVVPQVTLPAGHVHAPAVHTCEGPQVTPQAPQLLASTAVLAQRPEQ
jgi:hypothetical protein